MNRACISDPARHRRPLAAVAVALALRRRRPRRTRSRSASFPVSSSLPYFVALERGFFKEQNIEPEMIRLIGGPPNVAAMITNQIDASAVLVTHRRHERQHQEARRRDVHLDQQPEQDLPDGAVRRPQGARGEVARGPQGQEDHVGARAGQRHHGEGGARRGRPQGRRLHASTSSTWASTSTP